MHYNYIVQNDKLVCYCKDLDSLVMPLGLQMSLVLLQGPKNLGLHLTSYCTIICNELVNSREKDLI